MDRFFACQQHHHLIDAKGQTVFARGALDHVEFHHPEDVSAVVVAVELCQAKFVGQKLSD